MAGLAKPALFVPETKKADDTLRYLQSEQNHMALVVDEYGGIAGLVTMEDLMEELVGEITDEYDNGDARVAELGEDRYRFSVRFPLDDMADLFDMDIDEEDVDTVGGLMTVSLGRLPQTGSQTEIHGLMMTADPPVSSKAPVTTVVVEPTPALRRQLRERRALEGTLTGEIPLP
ncbi:MAG: Magnesium and cobalt efflux protein CorC [Cellulomonadaceae bacterium TMED98]|nr:MAG: Magnesium and cobalt efflux protein CorC [Cellulomonadaceae bacterium TMED98]